MRRQKTESIKNITRFTYDHTSFQGWRVCFTSKGTIFTKYFSDRKCGGKTKAFKMAKAKLAEAKEIVSTGRLRSGKLSKATIDKVNKALGIK